MGNNIGFGYVLKNRNFDQDPRWIEHYEQIKYPEKNLWISFIRKNLFIKETLWTQFSSELRKYYDEQFKQFTYRTFSCNKTRNILNMLPGRRDHHCKECALCDRVYRHWINLANDEQWTVLDKKTSIDRLISESLDFLEKEQKETIKKIDLVQQSDFRHLERLVKFLQNDCYDAVSTIPDYFEKTTIILESEPGIKITVGELYRLLHEIKVYNEAATDFEKQKEKHLKLQNPENNETQETKPTV